MNIKIDIEMSPEELRRFFVRKNEENPRYRAA